MVMPAFDMEPSSTSAPDGNPASPRHDDTAVAPPASPEAGPAKPPGGEMAPSRPPAASLVSIAAKNKPAAPRKSGDLTRFFELARHQSEALVDASRSVEPVPGAAAPTDFDAPPEPTLTATRTPVAEVSPEIECAPESPRVEPMGFSEPTIVSRTAFDVLDPSIDTDFPLLLAPPVAEEISDATVPVPIEAAPAAEPWALAPVLPADISAETAEHLPVVPAPTDESLEIPEPAPEVVEPPTIPAPNAEIEPAAAYEPESPRVLEPAPPVARTPVERLAVPVAPTALAAPKFTELADYWRSLRRGDDHPAIEWVDRDLVAERWPGALLIGFTPASQDPRGELRPGRVTWLGAACAAAQSAVDAGSHSTEWMLDVARTAVINDEPLEEQQRLATLMGDAGFRMVALPLGSPKGLANAALCMLIPTSGAPRFGKRRTWL